jgi:hypothetical protein
MASKAWLRKVEGDEVAIPAPPANVSVGRRWKFRRNVLIYFASQHGFPQAYLADVFDLPRSRIAAILKEFRDQYEA